MNVRIFLESTTVNSLSELREVLKSRHESKFGSFWLYHSNGSELGFMANGNDAYIHFFPASGSAGYRPAGTEPDNWGDLVTFLADNYEQTELPKAMVLSLSSASLAVEEFFVNGTLPRGVEWVEL